MVTERDREILEMLCCRVRMVSLGQLARHWWADTKNGIENARRRLTTLADAGWLQQASVMATPLPEMQQPVSSWKPGDDAPAFGSIAWKLQSRWQHEPRKTVIIFATKWATQIFGGRAPGRIKQEYQATHDLGVCEMYLLFRSHHSDAAKRWISEDTLAPHRRGQKLPDAVVAAGAGERPELVLEFGGAYDKKRLIEFHSDNEQRGLPYEIW